MVSMLKIAGVLLFSICIVITPDDCFHFELIMVNPTWCLHLFVCLLFSRRRYLPLSHTRLPGEHMAYSQQPTPHSSASLPLPCLYRWVCVCVCVHAYVGITSVLGILAVAKLVVIDLKANSTFIEIIFFVCMYIDVWEQNGNLEDCVGSYHTDNSQHHHHCIEKHSSDALITPSHF